MRHDLDGESDLEVEAVTDFHEAESILLSRPPDAAVVSLPPAQLDWHGFQHLCATREPPVPVLYESCVHCGARDAGLEPVEGYANFLSKPAPAAALRLALEELLREAHRLHGGNGELRAARARS